LNPLCDTNVSLSKALDP